MLLWRDGMEVPLAPRDKERLLRIAKIMVDNLFHRAEVQIKSGDVHENQGYELQCHMDDWLSSFDKFLTYQERQRIITYFFRKMDSLTPKGHPCIDNSKSNGAALE